MSVEQLFLTAVADFIPRGAKSPEGRLMPLQMHMSDIEREGVVASANAAGESVNHYIRRAVSARRTSEKMQGHPWKIRSKKAAERAAAHKAAMTVEAVSDAA
jgi:hypothetical protein